MCLSNHFSFAAFACSSLISSASLSFSLEVLDTSFFLVIFYSLCCPSNIFWQSCCALLSFFLSFDFEDASSLIDAPADVRRVPKLSKKFSLINSTCSYFIESWGILLYFKTFLYLCIGIGFCEDCSYWWFANISFDLFFFTLFCMNFYP